MILTLTETNGVFELYDGKSLKLYTPEEIFPAIMVLFQDNDTNKKGLDLYINELNLWGPDFVINLKDYYEDVTKDFVQCGLGDAEPFTFKYVVATIGTWYSISVKNNVAIHTLYSFNNLIPLTNKALKESFPSESLAVSMHMAISELDSIAKLRTTTSQTAYATWRSSFKQSDFKAIMRDAKEINLPNCLTLDQFLRPAYSGGWCYLKPGCGNRTYVNGITLDVNSLYPYEMKTKSMPIGSPKYFTGEVPANIKTVNFYRYFVHFRCRCSVKNGMLPFVHCTGSRFHNRFEIIETTNYVDEMNNEHENYIDEDGVKHKIIEEFVLSDVEYNLFLEHYNITDLEIIDGVYFRAVFGLFTDFVNMYYGMKSTTTGGRRRMVKIILNALSGKMGSKPERFNQIFDEDLTVIKVESKSASHVPVAAIITSEARCDIVRSAQANYKHFLYSDTDSLHLDCPVDQVVDLEIDEEKLGAFKLERQWDYAKFYKQKAYIEICGDKPHLTFSGISLDTQAMIESVLAYDFTDKAKPDYIPDDCFGKLKMLRFFITPDSLDKTTKILSMISFPEYQYEGMNFKRIPHMHYVQLKL